MYSAAQLNREIVKHLEDFTLSVIHGDLEHRKWLMKEAEKYIRIHLYGQDPEEVEEGKNEFNKP